MQLTHSLKAPWFQPLDLSSENLISKFAAFTCNLCRYSAALSATTRRVKSVKGYVLGKGAGKGARRGLDRGGGPVAVGSFPEASFAAGGDASRGLVSSTVAGGGGGAGGAGGAGAGAGPAASLQSSSLPAGEGARMEEAEVMQVITDSSAVVEALQKELRDCMAMYREDNAILIPVPDTDPPALAEFIDESKLDYIV
jgi:hypothetical protein